MQAVETFSPNRRSAPKSTAESPDLKNSISKRCQLAELLRDPLFAAEAKRSAKRHIREAGPWPEVPEAPQLAEASLGAGQREQEFPEWAMKVLEETFVSEPESHQLVEMPRLDPKLYSALIIRVERVFREWIRMCGMGEVDQNPHSSLAHIIQEIHADGLMSSDLMIASFFRICIDICVIKYHAMTVEAKRSLRPQQPALAIEAFVKLVCSILRLSDPSLPSTKINLARQFLNIVANCALLEAKKHGPSFDAGPFYRILLGTYTGVMRPGDGIDRIRNGVRDDFRKTLQLLRSRLSPDLPSSWLDVLNDLTVPSIQPHPTQM